MNIMEAYKFCPLCGGNFTANNSTLTCQKCKKDYYPNPKPVTEIVLKNDKGEYLFCIRAHEPNKGRLDFPGGFVEENEDFEQSVRREVKEELGIELGDIEYIGSQFDTYLFQGVNYNVIGASYYGKLPRGVELQANDDVAGFEFYKFEDIPMDRLAGNEGSVTLKNLAEHEARIN